MESAINRFKIAFFVPEAYKESVKQAMFEKGAGRYDNYDCCSWETQGQGQFRPLEKSQPFIGQSGQLEKVNEYRVEMLCSADNIESVVKALLKQHPYEVPAYEVWPVYLVDDL